MSTVRSFLDGLDRRLRFAALVVLGFVMVTAVDLVISPDTVWTALRLATVATIACVAGRAFRVGTWPWRSPGDDEDPT